MGIMPDSNKKAELRAILEELDEIRLRTSQQEDEDCRDSVIALAEIAGRIAALLA